jgi:hypothetical protein
MQETGQPPAEIMKGLTPDLDTSQLFSDANPEKCSLM